MSIRCGILPHKPAGQGKYSDVGNAAADLLAVIKKQARE